MSAHNGFLEIAIVAAVVGIIVLQIRLSKKESKWFGLIMPIVLFCISMLIVFGVVAYTFVPGEITSKTVSENGEIVSFDKIVLFLVQKKIPHNIVQESFFILRMQLLSGQESNA